VRAEDGKVGNMKKRVEERDGRVEILIPVERSGGTAIRVANCYLHGASI
jgi:hypothetical protein